MTAKLLEVFVAFTVFAFPIAAIRIEDLAEITDIGVELNVKSEKSARRTQFAEQEKQIQKVEVAVNVSQEVNRFFTQTSKYCRERGFGKMTRQSKATCKTVYDNVLMNFCLVSGGVNHHNMSPFKK